MSEDGIDQDDAYWLRMMGSRWSQPALSAAEVAALLDIADPADLLGRTSRLPRPDRDPGGAQRWSQATVYDYILVHHPELQNRVPRLYPFTAALGPAKFLFGQVVDGWAVHAWQPSDGRGPVAVAYAGHEQHENELYSLAEPLLARLPWATAVCLPEMSTHRANDGAAAPYVAVIDRHHPVAAYGWFEVAGLLRVDLPWWPPVLRNVDAIAAWQPGAPTQRIRARAGKEDPRRLGALVTPDSSEYVTALVNRAIEFLNREAASGCIGDQNRREMPGRRGLRHAAVADVDLSRPAVHITKAEVAVLLHQDCDDPAVAADIFRLLAGHSPIVDVLTIPIASNALAGEWLARLQPTADDRELGFWRARAHHAAAATTTAYRDPLNPHCWAVATVDTIYAAVGRSVPATGQLTELFYERRGGGMFRDSRGTVWPLPATGFGVTDAGPHGSRGGKETLVQILTNLLLDASDDVTRREAPNDPSSPLAQLVATTELPLAIKPGDPVLAIGDEGRR